MATGNGLRDIFLAGIGALAITGDKAREVVDKLIEQGELTVEQGKEINSELTHKAVQATAKVGDAALEEYLKRLSPEDRATFVEHAQAVAAKIAADEAPTEVEEVEVVDEEAEETEEAE